MERSKPYKGAARLGRLTLGIALPVAMALGMGAIAPAATAANSTCTPDKSTIAQCFPDPGLAHAVAQATGGYDDATGSYDVGQPLTKHDIASITKLDDTGDGVDNLQGIENLTNLTNLNFYGNNNQISDLSPLAKLTKITDLELNSNQISDVGPLANLTNLTSLDLLGNRVSDVGPLANLTKLTTLTLDNNRVSDVGPLSKLTKLTDLHLYGNQISDLGQLSNLTNLTNLNLGGNRVSDVGPLSKLTKLTGLRLDDNQISDVGPLSKLTKLTGLRLDDNQISDVGPLSKLTNLDWLGLGDNRVSDVGPLSKLTNLTGLQLYGNRVSDVGPLSKLTNLGRLYLSGNQISDLSPLAKLTNLYNVAPGSDPNVDLGSQSVSLPAVASSSLSVPTARRADGSFIKPDTLAPSSGSYEAKTGKASWKGLSGSGSVSLHVGALVTIGNASSWFDVTITQPYTPPTAPVAKYTVSFDAQSGSAVASQSVVKGGKAIKPADPTRSGYTFAGWSSDKTGSKPYDFSTAVSANLTLYAQWKAVPPAKLATVLSAAGSSNVTADSATVSATLKDPAGKPVAGAGVTFTTADGKTSASVKTDASGVSKASLTGLKAATKYSVTAKYAGDATHSASTLGLPISFTTKAVAKPVPSVVISFDANGGRFANGSAMQQVSAKQGAKYALAAAPSRAGYSFAGWFTAKTGGSKVTGSPVATASRTLYAQWAKSTPAPKPLLGTPVPVYRVYNKRSGLHHYTTNLTEKNALVKLGWKDEGASFNAAKQNSANGLKPVYREYNPHNGNHNWTLDPSEHKTLVKLGWKDEGVAWYANPSGPVTVYRLYNPHSGEHVYTTSAKEYAAVGAAGWHQEGTAWKGL
jgi:uncharacterized repeat protein (TIGR02543 family)